MIYNKEVLPVKNFQQYVDLYIGKKDECFKVFIHETFHSFGLDFSSMSQILANRIISSAFRITNKTIDFKIYES